MKRQKYEKRRQHFVAASYLKAWQDPSAPKSSTNTPFVWTFDKNGKNPKAKAPAKIFRETDMYTLTMPDGSQDLKLENGLGEIESNFIRIRNSKFNFKRELSQTEWKWTCLFVATAYVRTVVYRDHAVGNLEKIKDLFEKVAGPDWETRTIAQELPPHVDPTRTYIPRPGDFDNLKETATQALFGSAIEVILPALQRMHKTVLCTTDQLGFLTSDAPSTWCDPTDYRRHPFERGAALMKPDVEITLPISPQQCIVFTHRPFGPLYVDVSTKVVDLLNHRHATFAPSTIVVRHQATRPSWFEVGSCPADAWEVLNPDPEARNSWTNPNCTLDDLAFLRKLSEEGK